MNKKNSKALKEIKAEIFRNRNKEKAKIFQRFFKTGKDEYGEGDIFLGLSVPIQRQIVKKFLFLGLKDLSVLIKSPIHEHRLCALLIIIEQYKKGDKKVKQKIFNFYLKNAKKINNWDLVDVSAGNIIGEHLFPLKKDILYKLAKSHNLWEKRIAIISTLAFIRKNCFKDTIYIAEILINDKHDLIHKASGWMLREIGKRSQNDLIEFLNNYKNKMPRTMLRYAIEKFSADERKKYLKS